MTTKSPKSTIAGGIYLTPTAAKEYRSIKSRLKKERGETFNTDDAAIALLAYQIDQLNSCTREVQEYGSMILESDSREGTSRKAHPALNMIKELQTQIRLSLIELGMTPKSKKQMQVEQPTTETNPITALMNTLNQD